LHHAVERLAPCILVELDVRPDLAPSEAFEPGGDVAADASRPDSEAKTWPMVFTTLSAWDVLGGGDDHGREV